MKESRQSGREVRVQDDNIIGNKNARSSLTFRNYCELLLLTCKAKDTEKAREVF